MNLTDKAYWISLHQVLSRKLPISINPIRYPYKLFDGIFKRMLPLNKTFIEIGCAPGSWLVYFAKEFGYRVYGIDYSKIGCELTRKNLKANSVRGRVICADFFKHRFNKKFDVVFSYGFIEHFSDTKEIMQRHIRLSKRGGYVIIIYPNMRGLVSFLQRIANKDIFKMHKKIQKNELKNFLKEFRMRILFLNYFGSWNSFVINFGKQNKLFYYHKAIVNKIVHFFFEKLTIKPESSFISPYVMLIAKVE